MNKRKFTLTSILAALLLSAAPEADAAPVSPGDALREAMRFRSINAGTLRRAPAKGEPTLAYEAQSPSGDNCFYIFNYPSGTGFTVVSADDRLPAVIGFSDSGSFDAAAIPSNMKWWLGEYTRQISTFIAEDPDVPRMPMRAIAKDYDEIAPLLTSKWDQGAPYNNDCPMDNRVHARSVTGCVATAMAQVMRHHRWPVNPTGSAYGYIFEGQTLDWANMIDDYSGAYNTAQANAVALLMRMCGAGVNMMYSAYESGAYSQDVPTALIENFGYNASMEMQWRDYHSQLEWNRIVYDELAANRPVYYSGQSSLGGHAFVCDGYLADGYFHFNWGWGGYQDGYFLLSALNPAVGGTGSYDGGYNTNQSIITGVKKSEGETQRQQAALATGSFSYSGSGSNGEFVITDDPEGYYMIYNPTATPLSASFGVKVTPVDNPDDAHHYSLGSQSLQPLYGFKSMKANFSPNLPDGMYRVSPAFMKRNGEWTDVQVPYSRQRYVLMELKGGKKIFTNPGVPVWTGEDMTAGLPETTSTLYGDVAKSIRVVFSNFADTDFQGKVVLTVSDEVDPFGDVFSSYADALVPEHSSAVVEFTSPVVLREGTYTVFIQDYDGIDFIQPYEMEVRTAGLHVPEEGGSLEVTHASPSFYTIDDEGLPMSLNVTNSGEKAATRKVGVVIYDSAFKEVYSREFKEVTFEGQRSTNLSIAPQPVPLQPGSYFWAVRFDGEQASMVYPLVIRSAVREKDGISYVVTDEARKQAMVVPPSFGEYSGKVMIPDVIDGYTVTGVRANTFSFADGVTEVSLPSGVEHVQPGTFTAATSLQRLDVSSKTPAVVWPQAFGEGAPERIVLSPADGLANFYAAEDGWAVFRISNWTIECGAGCEITGGLLTDPLTNGFYSPYYVGADERLAINVTVPEGKVVRAEWSVDGGESSADNFSGPVVLPALGGRSGKVSLAVADGAGIDDVTEDWKPCDVYRPDGVRVLRHASYEEFRALPEGLYILRGVKVAK